MVLAGLILERVPAAAGVGGYREWQLGGVMRSNTEKIKKALDINTKT